MCKRHFERNETKDFNVEHTTIPVYTMNTIAIAIAIEFIIAWILCAFCVNN